MKKRTACFTAALCAGSAFALIEPIPEESGFSGFVMGGVSVNRVESSMIAGTDFGDISSSSVNSIYKSPSANTDSTPAFGGEVKYTFASTRTQILLGNSFEDWARYDFTSVLGVRQEVEGFGILEGSLLFTSFPTEVWEDPYVANQRRKETDRDSTGGRIGMYNIMGSRLDLRLSAREIELDDELSGANEIVLGNITPGEAKRLDREGTEYKVDLTYNWIMNEKHILSPQIVATQFDLDGDAMAGDKYALQLTHAYRNGRWNLLTNIAGSVSEYDKRNPIYDDKRDALGWGGSFTVIYGKLFDIEGLALRGSLVYFEEDSDIDFYDFSVRGGTVGLLYKF